MLVGQLVGTDIVARILNKYTHISMGKLLFILDFLYSHAHSPHLQGFEIWFPTRSYLILSFLVLSI